jgi:hypothetical protein
MLYYDIEKYMNLKGFTTNEFDTYKPDSILNKIKVRLSFFPNEFGIVDNVEYNSLSSHETMRRWWQNDELILNPNPILLRGSFTIKFKL